MRANTVTFDVYACNN